MEDAAPTKQLSVLSSAFVPVSHRQHRLAAS